jgi:hypothetical protein
VKISPVGPGVPAGLADLLNDLRNAVLELSEPTYPHRAFACLKASLPPAGDYPHCFVFITDLNTPACSDGTHWRRADTGAAI